MTTMTETVNRLHTLAEMCTKYLPETVNDGISISLTPDARAANSPLWYFQVVGTENGERYAVSRTFNTNYLAHSRLDEFALLAKAAVQQLALVISSSRSIAEME